MAWSAVWYLAGRLYAGSISNVFVVSVTMVERWCIALCFMQGQTVVRDFMQRQSLLTTPPLLVPTRLKFHFIYTISASTEASFAISLTIPRAHSLLHIFSPDDPDCTSQPHSPCNVLCTVHQYHCRWFFAHSHDLSWDWLVLFTHSFALSTSSQLRTRL